LGAAKPYTRLDDLYRQNLCHATNGSAYSQKKDKNINKDYKDKGSKQLS